MPARRPVAAAAAALLAALAAAPALGQSHAVAEYRSPKYGPNFQHFDYVNPDAPQGGQLTLSSRATFNSFNNFIAQGTSAPGLGLLYQSLTVPAADERFGRYGALAKTIDIADDNTAVTFTLREAAQFHDGHPVLAEDVVWTFRTRMEKGAPGFKTIFRGVKSVQATGKRTVRFTLKRPDRGLAIELGGLEILPKHWWKKRKFGATTLDKPLGSGPYKIADFESQRTITYKRVEDWWADDLPVYVGRYNFTTIRYEIYFDEQARFQAFKAGQVDFRRENQAKRWAEAYDFPAVDQGKVATKLRPHDEVIGMQGYVFNTRRALFADRDVRAAISRLFNFEWTNQNLFNGQYTRTDSFFENSELAATGLPTGREKQLLAKHREHLPNKVFTQPFDPPETDGSKTSRKQLRKALARLNSAGWTNQDGKLVDAETGKQMSFEILISQAGIERVTLPFKQNLERIGIDVSVKRVDTNTYLNRLRKHDFDMTLMSFPDLSAPGNELRTIFHSASANQRASYNLFGIRNPAIDALVERAVAAESWGELKPAVRALDRALLWGHYVIPNWHLAGYRIAYWDVFGRPGTTPSFGLHHIDTWWRAHKQPQAD